MARAIEETNRRREKQIEYNRKHHITPRSIVTSVDEVMLSTSVMRHEAKPRGRGARGGDSSFPEGGDDPELLKRLEAERKEAEALHFEKATSIMGWRRSG